MTERTLNRSGLRIISLLLALALMLSAAPATALTQPVSAAQYVMIYFRNADGWDDVYGYVWDGTNTPLLGDWPGKPLSMGDNDLYLLSVPFTPSVTNKFNFIFNNNAGSQTADLSLTYSQLISGEVFWVNGKDGQPAMMKIPAAKDGSVTFTYEGTASKVYVAGSFNGWSSTANAMTKSGNTFTYTCKLDPGVYEYKFVADGSWTNDPHNPQITGSDNNNYFIVAGMPDTSVSAVKGMANTLPTELTCLDGVGKEQVRPVTYRLSGSPKGVTLSGNTLTVAADCTLSSCALTATTADGFTCKVTVNLLSADTKATTVKLHFIDSLGWGGVCARVWTKSGSSNTAVNGYSWPGQVLQPDEQGNPTLELTHYPVAGQALGFNFHDNNGQQTKDLSISDTDLASGKVELWIQPGKAGPNGRYSCTTSSALPTQLSPVVEGNKVTFRYVSSTAKTVYVAGSFNSWSSTAAKMTKSGSVFTYTATLSAGIHEYKFLVDSKWMLDPQNSAPGGYDGNSMVIVGGKAPSNTGKVTVKLHYYRPGSYTGWDAWMWCDNKGGAGYPFANDTKGKVATITVDGKTNSFVSYILRKTDWSDQEFSDRVIDISEVTSGTVHYYINSGSETGYLVYDTDVVFGGKPVYANYDYESGRVWVKTSLPLSGTLSSAFSIVKAGGGASGISVSGVSVDNGGYSLTLSRRLKLGELEQLRVKCGSTCEIETENLFDSEAFAREYTYKGGDLGANWSETSTTFKVWAPTATKVSVMRYRGGNYGGGDWIATTDMKQGEQGVWEVTINGNLHGQYYNYLVKFPTYECEATDPYAASTGANGDRGMILDMDSTNPTGWDQDVSPNQGMSYTDAIIYEMHIREFTIDSSSGVKSAWRGKYLGLTQTGTKYNGEATGLDHLKELGITHVQLMPTYDYNSVDEYHLTDWQQYAWGYDPRNYNVPEGSYSTDPFKGEVRVREFKQMVQTFHSSGINVIMDVVYNHAFSGGDFCYNQIVPTYFSRFWDENNWSNGSGCGNDIATERSMVRQYIVESILHWVEEYHIDGFRFDLAGLIDTQTINDIVNTVHAKYPNVIFYGEGWGTGDTAVAPGYALATKGNAWMTPGFGFFNDDFRNAIAGDNGNSCGFASGDGGKADAIAGFFRASNGWSTDPEQTINYVSCHDNYSLMDKLCISRNGAYWDQLVKMNNLSASIYMLSQGTPFIYSGEELLREKKNQAGDRINNAHGTDDYVNKIRWSDLKNKTLAATTDDYYAGLVEFRKNHAALRCPNGSDAWKYVSYHKINNNCILFYVDGYPNYECSDGIVIIYNAQEKSQSVNLSNYGIPSGTWQACIHGNKAGNSALWSTSNGNVTVEGISATVLVKGDLTDENSVYNRQNIVCTHPVHSTGGVCTGCGKTVEHSFYNGSCTGCGLRDPEYKVNYYLIGYINGKDYGFSADEANMGQYKFENGQLTARFTQNSYIGVKQENNAAFYWTKTYTTGTSGTFYSSGASEKMLVPGGVDLTFTLKENADGSLTLSYVRGVNTTVSGKVTSYGDASEAVTVSVWSGDKQVASVSTTNGTYSLKAAPGSYTLKVSKKNHVTREYAITLSGTTLAQDVKICLVGDATGDGKVNLADVAKIFAHVRNKTLITDDYVKACADATGDGKLNLADVARVFAHVRGKNPLF